MLDFLELLDVPGPVSAAPRAKPVSAARLRHAHAAAGTEHGWRASKAKKLISHSENLPNKENDLDVPKLQIHAVLCWAT